VFVVQICSPKNRKWLFGISGARYVVPTTEPETRQYRVSQSTNGQPEVIAVPRSEEGTDTLLDTREVFAQVSTRPVHCELLFARISTGSDDHQWDMRIDGTWNINTPQKFLCEFGLSVASVETPLSSDIVDSWLVSILQARVRDAVREYSIEELRNEHALPARWWETQVSEWLADTGLTVRVTSVFWSSADAAAAEAEERRLEDLARLESERSREREAELREAQSQSEYEQERLQIEQDATLSSTERDHQLQLLEKRHRQEVIDAELAIENARRAADHAALDHEVRMARSRNDLDSIELAEKRQAESDHRHDETMSVLSELGDTVKMLAELPNNLLKQLADREEPTAHAARERLTSPEFGVHPEQLEMLGFRSTPQFLEEHLRRKSTADNRPIRIEKTQLQCRDIGRAKVNALPVNTSLRFEFEANREGFLTLLNIGTSGSVYLHVPNYTAQRDVSRVTPGRPYSIPGPELLPWDIVGDYVEIGPPGWEHIAVFVSDEPLLSEEVVQRSSPESPLVKLTGQELEQLLSLLQERTPNSWVVGICSFLVE